MVTVKNTEVNTGLEAWRGLNALYDSNNQGRQRVRMQYFLQPKRAESILQTTEVVEGWDCDAREYEQRLGKTLDEDVKIGVILALSTFASAEPLPLELTHPEEVRAGKDVAVRLLPSTSDGSQTLPLRDLEEMPHRFWGGHATGSWAPLGHALQRLQADVIVSPSLQGRSGSCVVFFLSLILSHVFGSGSQRLQKHCTHSDYKVLL